ncbi:hypothetical protein [Planomicrobium sp. CPCC 101079]|uniref:hypothetical protein n=1 Tax=Planomicrobium sp. CPCC 101079 TaxID=2599618 RepID=UPI0011B64815|nr:hypothetical protein [Planomicrobium sp. CPCC 101079]TWT03563.1 hypothetical protein FQV28_11115 [Planomicrobium sp. CPCC 101079]
MKEPQNFMKKILASVVSVKTKPVKWISKRFFINSDEFLKVPDKKRNLHAATLMHQVENQ